jgi:Uma2 family endonuclease
MATIVEQPAESMPERSEATSPVLNIRRFSPDEYIRMGDVGILSGDEKVELLEGYVVTMMMRRPPHDATILNLDDALRPICPKDYHLRFQMAIALADSFPEPDCAVIRGARRRDDHRFPGPGEIEMVIEVSDSTLRIDRQTKSRIYAKAGIPAYWIVNIGDRQIEVLSDPNGDSTKPGYRTTKSFGEKDQIPFLLGGVVIANLAVADILP